MVDFMDGLDVCGHMQSWPRFDWVPAFTEPFPMFQISFWQLHWICIYLITRGALTPLAPIGCRRIASVCGTTKPFFSYIVPWPQCYYLDIKRIQKPKTLSLVVVWVCWHEVTYFHAVTASPAHCWLRAYEWETNNQIYIFFVWVRLNQYDTAVKYTFTTGIHASDIKQF